MLITNFSSGELSPTLFGRIDLGQYYNAAAKLENFDVIPTGGVKKRGGTHRVGDALGRPGRIIPFIVDRENSYLLYLSPKNGNTPARISVYSKEGTLKTFVESTESFKLFQTMDDINQVQHAQNFDVMILCHENNNPVEVKFENGSLAIRLFNISYKVKTLVSQNLNENNYVEFDNNNNLLKEGNFPRCVSFFNGRLFFAGTKTMPQRIFASKMGDIHDFSTYKLSVQEVREYFTVLSTITDEGTIKISKPETAIRFVKPINEYYVDSIYFPPGTRIREINGNKFILEDEITLTEPINKNIFTKERIEEELKKVKEIYDEAEKKVKRPNSATETMYANVKTFFTFSYNEDYYDPGAAHQLINRRLWTYTYNLRYGAYKIQIERIVNSKYTIGGSGRSETNYWYSEYGIGEDIASKKPEDISDEFITLKIRNLIDNAIKNVGSVSGEGYFYNGNYMLEKWDVAEKEEVVSYMKNAILNGMKYRLHNEADDGTYEEWYCDEPENIINSIRPFLVATENIYVSFFTREFIKDRYPSPDDGFAFEIASDMSDSIKWIGQNKNLIVGTETGEWIIPAGVHATNQQAVLNSRYGSDNIQGAAIGDAFCFIQTGKRSIVEYYIPQADNHFRANNMAMMAAQMLGESKKSKAKFFDFTSSPYTQIFIVREDGAMVTLLYERSTGTFAWSRFTTKGVLPDDGVKSLAVVPGANGYDDVYLLVERGGKHYLEVFEFDGGVFLDGYKEIKNHNDFVKELPAYSAGGLAPKISRVYTAAKKVADFGRLIQVEETRYETLGADKEPDWTKGGDFYIGYPYTSTMRTMPILANDKMKKQRIVNLGFRFLESYLPRMTSVIAGERRQADTLTQREPPYSGIYKQVFPGSWDEEVQVELTSDEAAPVKILALNAGMAEG